MKKRDLAILLHVFGCVIFLSLPILLRPGSMEVSSVFDDPRARLDFFTYVLLIIFFYLNFFIFIPKLYFGSRQLLFFGIMLASFLVIVFFPEIVVGYGPPPPGMHHMPPPPKPRGPAGWIMFRTGSVFFLFMIALFLSLIIRITGRWKQTEQEKLSAELSYLKAQINPHFLFNTLNSIYSLAIIKSEHTASAIVKLSGMMRYVINEAHLNVVSLDREIEYIRSFIDLQRIRFENAVVVTFDVHGMTFGKKIAPLILISFIENAFKHGVNAEENSDIKVNIHIIEDTLTLRVHNNKVFVQHRDDSKTGLGIDNTKGRLELLYPGRHSLNIINTDKAFSVVLEMILK